ncbi:Phage portal protein, lambda family [Planctomycetes bacterium Pan216]|uniref:Phage portal protein, lambda family n=1 Tax=Kolteria novifilia TaxID=2527975 RepID=A0A518B2S3_9BACT|nr:Phage portal protein, lambda family [Planctomycetes bacterium Pan216]
MSLSYPELLDRVSKGNGRYSPQAGYVGGQLTRTNADFRPRNRSADAHVKSDDKLLKARSRWLGRNNPMCIGVKNTLVNNVIGTGIKTKAQVRDASGELLKDFNTQADDLYARWMGEADTRGRQHWYQMSRTNLHETIEAGNGFLVERQINDPGRLIPLAFELRESDQLDETRDRPAGDGVNEIRRGIEFDGRGRAVAYYFWTEHPGGVYTGRYESERIPAWQVIHLYRGERPSQTQGVSWFAPLVRNLWHLYDYMEYEIAAAKVASYFVYMHKRDDWGEGADDYFVDENGDAGPLDVDGNEMLPLGPGIGLTGGPNDSIEVIQSNRPNSQATAWITLLMQMMGNGVGLSLQRFTGDYSKTNFSSARAGDLQDRKGFVPMQHWHTWYVDLEVRRRVTQQLIGSGLLPVPNGGIARFNRNPFRWLQAVARPPGWGYVDPEKQIRAAKEAIAAGLGNFELFFADIGLDSVEVHKKLAEELKDMKADGLPVEQMLWGKIEQMAAEAQSAREEEEDEE